MSEVLTMLADDFDRDALRALDPAMQAGLNEAQRDALARAIVAAWAASLAVADDRPSHSGVYIKGAGGPR